MIYESSQPGMSSFPVIVAELRRMNLTLQHQRSQYFNNCSRVQVAQIFQTVRIDGGRQCGKTTCLIQMTKPHDAVFAYGRHQAQVIDSHVSCPVYNSRVPALQLRSNMPAAQTVWIDEASYVSPDVMEEIYEAYAGIAQQFVLLG